MNTFFYEGEEISEEVVESEALACSQTASGHYCFDDVAAAEAAFSDDSKSSAENAPSAARACAIVRLWEYTDINYGGRAYDLKYIGGYINYADINNNRTTSFQSGEAASIFADYAGGGGPKYTGTGTGYCGYQPNLRPTDWNNKFSSRARIGV